MIQRDTSLFTALKKAYPEKAFLVTGDRYEDIVWRDGVPIDEADVHQVYLSELKSLYVAELLSEAEEQRRSAMEQVFQTSDLTQVRVYDVKYESACNYTEAVAANDGDTSAVSLPPVLAREFEVTGEDPLAMANLIKVEYEASHAILGDFFGKIEGVRRAQKDLILSILTIGELDQLPAVVWPSLQMN